MTLKSQLPSLVELEMLESGGHLKPGGGPSPVRQCPAVQMGFGSFRKRPVRFESIDSFHFSFDRSAGMDTSTQSASASTSVAASSPSGVRVYSTRGGTTGKLFRFRRPSPSSC